MKKNVSFHFFSLLAFVICVPFSLSAHTPGQVKDSGSKEGAGDRHLISEKHSQKENVPSVASPYPRVNFRLEAINFDSTKITVDEAISMVFHPNATHGWDVYDATKQAPFSDPYAILSFMGERNNNTVYKAQDSRPQFFEGSFLAPLSLDTWNMSGTYTITWELLNDVPDYWMFKLFDTETGEITDLQNDDSYVFIKNGQNKAVSEHATPQLEHPYRFSLFVSSDPFSRLMTGAAGWYMLSVPSQGVTIEDLAGQNQIQGIPGLADFYDDPPEGIEDDTPNIFTHYEDMWYAPGDISDEIVSGKGFIWYFYDNYEGVSTSFPFVLGTGGTTPENDVEVPIHDSGNGFNLLGNPFYGDLEITQMADWVSGGSLGSVIAQFWKNDDAGWQQGVGHQGTWVLVGSGNNDDIIETWRGFMIENQDAETITFPVTALAEEPSSFKKISTPGKRLSFHLKGHNPYNDTRTRDETHLLLTDVDEEKINLFNASKLTPLSSAYATLSFQKEAMDVTKNTPKLFAQIARPLSFEGEIELPLALHTKNMNGTLTLRLEGISQLPPEWQLILVDHYESKTIDLRNYPSYTFYLPQSDDPDEQWLSNEIRSAPDQVNPLAKSVKDVSSSPRFSLHLSTEPLSGRVNRELPESLELAQNYPNPFNPATNITFSLPAQSDVRLAVYDLTGRKVTLLLEEQKGPGEHTVSWNAEKQASGIYLYRLETENRIISRRMTLLK